MILALVFGIVGACASGNGEFRSRLISVGCHKGAIFLNAKPSHVSQMGITRATGTWVPSLNEVRMAEAATEGYLKDQYVSKAVSGLRYVTFADISEKYCEYSIQFVGFVRDGKRYILCQYLVEKAIMLDWKVQPIGCNDGGSDCFSSEYDVNEDKCTAINVEYGA